MFSLHSRLAMAARSRYEDLVLRASSVDFGGVPVRVAAFDDIIASKEWANRPKDRAALDELHRLAEDELP